MRRLTVRDTIDTFLAAPAADRRRGLASQGLVYWLAGLGIVYIVDGLLGRNDAMYSAALLPIWFWGICHITSAAWLLREYAHFLVSPTEKRRRRLWWPVTATFALFTHTLVMYAYVFELSTAVVSYGIAMFLTRGMWFLCIPPWTSK